MNEIEIHFKSNGNTVVGDYVPYLVLRAAIERKNVPPPNGFCINGEPADIRRLAEYVDLFGNCIVNHRGWRKASELAGVQLTKSV